MLKRLYDQSTN